MTYERLSKSDWEPSKGLTAYCFQDNTNNFTDWFYNTRAGQIFALKDPQGEILAQAISASTNVTARGKAASCAMISHVSTSPAHRARGLMNDLLPSMIRHLSNEGVMLAALYPSAYSFYTRYGFATCSDMTTSNIQLSRLHPKRLTYDLKLHDTTKTSKVSECYTRAFKDITGAQLSPDFNIADLTRDGASVATLQSNDQVMAYWTWRIDGGTIIIDNAAFVDATSRHDFLSYLATHASTIKEAKVKLPPFEPLLYMFPDRYYQTIIEPWDMFRILNLPSFANGLSAGSGSVTLNIIDDQAPNNRGIWRFESVCGKLAVSRADDLNAATLGIGPVTQWLMGYLDGTTLRDIGYPIPLDLSLAMDRLSPKGRVFIWEQY